MTETNDPTDRGRDGATGRTAMVILKRALNLFLQRGLKYTVPFLVLAVLLVIRTQFDETIVAPLRLKVFDTYQVIQPREYVDTPVRVLDIDDESLARIGQWPWPRTVLAQMLVNAFNAGAAVVAFDMVFAEPDRTSPTRVAESWLGTEDMADIMARIAKLPDHDAVFADVIAQTNVVAGFVLKAEPGGHPPKPKWGIAVAGDDPREFDRRIARFVGAVNNLDGIEQAANGIGSFNIVQDGDGVIRRVNLLFFLGDVLYPSLAAEALRIGQGASTYIIKSSGANMEESFGEYTGINHIKIGAFNVPTDRQGRIWVHYTREEDSRARYIPAWRLVEGDFDPAQIEGRILLVGTSAPGLKDLRITPLSPSAPGVEVHASIIEQVLNEHFLERPDWGDGAEILYLMALGFILVFLIPRLGAVWCAVLGAVTVAIAVAASWYAYADLRLLVDPVTPSVSGLAIYLVGSLINFMQSEAERRQVRGAFSQYLSPALVEQLAEDPSRLTLGGETKTMTFLFCDIRGFTPISELFKGDPQGLTKLINAFLTPMTDEIMARRGTIDKYMGDCIMAFWNAPLNDEDHIEHACRSALAMQTELVTLNGKLEQEAEAEGRKFIPINVGIGLNTGDCVVGNMGSEQRFDYSVLGDAVNLASRLEGQSKTYGVTIVLGEATAQQANGFAVLELDEIAVKGKSEAVRVFTLLGDEQRGGDAEFIRLKETAGSMLEAYRGQDWALARAKLEECRRIDGKLAGLWDLYEERVDVYEQDPPGPDWDGVFVATTK